MGQLWTRKRNSKTPRIDYYFHGRSPRERCLILEREFVPMKYIRALSLSFSTVKAGILLQDDDHPHSLTPGVHPDFGDYSHCIVDESAKSLWSQTRKTGWRMMIVPALIQEWTGQRLLVQRGWGLSLELLVGTTPELQLDFFEAQSLRLWYP